MLERVWLLLEILDINYPYMLLNCLCTQWFSAICLIVLQVGLRQGWPFWNPCTLYTNRLWKCLIKKPRHYHHCNIIKKHCLLTFDSFILFSDMCLMYKLTHDLAPPPLKQCVSFCRDNVRVSRASTRGDCYSTFKKTTFGQSAFSYQAIRKWNVIPLHIRDSLSFKSFKKSLKIWLKINQVCDH